MRCGSDARTVPARSTAAAKNTPAQRRANGREGSRCGRMIQDLDVRLAALPERGRGPPALRPIVLRTLDEVLAIHLGDPESIGRQRGAIAAEVLHDRARGIDRAFERSD